MCFVAIVLNHIQNNLLIFIPYQMDYWNTRFRQDRKVVEDYCSCSQGSDPCSSSIRLPVAVSGVVLDRCHSLPVVTVTDLSTAPVSHSQWFLLSFMQTLSPWLPCSFGKLVGGKRHLSSVA